MKIKKEHRIFLLIHILLVIFILIGTIVTLVRFRVRQTQPVKYKTPIVETTIGAFATPEPGTDFGGKASPSPR